MMHIAVVTKNMEAGGAERVIAQLLAGWVGKGVCCTLISMNPAPMFYTIPEQVTHIPIPEFSDNPVRNKLKKYIHLRNVLKDRNPDVVLSLPEEIGIYAGLFLLGIGIPVVISERNNPWVMPYKKITRLLRRLVYPFARGLIFQTGQAASFFPKSQQKKGIVLPNPLDLSRLPEPYTGERSKTVVGAGRLEEQKNFPLLIRAFAEFHKTHPEYSLTIYGEGQKRPELERLAGQCLPAGSWSLPGKVEDLPFRISRCGIFVLSSDYEGVPNVLIEAMAVGTPAVSTDCAPGGAASLLHSDENGLLVPVGDIHALAEGMAYLADHPSEASAMAEKALAVRTTLNAEKVTADWLSYLGKCAARPR